MMAESLVPLVTRSLAWVEQEAECKGQVLRRWAGD